MVDVRSAGSRRSGIVTPEAVVLELRLATLGSRVLAITLDLTIQLTGLFLVLLALGLVGNATGASLPGWVAVIIVTFLVFFAIFGYPVILETLWRGKTVGKRALGIRVVTTEGAPIRFRHAAIRAALEIPDFFIPPGGLVACLSVLFTRDDQRLGDLAAGTVVIHERSASGTGAPVWFPPPWGFESYTATLDVAGLDAEGYQLIRSFLIRANQLTPGARSMLATRLARPVASALHQLPPPGMSDEQFVACVAAAYQLRSRMGGGTLPPPVVPPPAEPPVMAPEQDGRAGVEPGQFAPPS